MKYFIISLFAVGTILSGCVNEPTSKKAYLTDFTSFVDEVEVNHENYTPKDWIDKDKVFHRYTEPWYAKFKSELLLKEKVEVKKQAVRYQIYRNKNEWSEGLEEGVRAIKEIGEELLQIVGVDSVKKKLKIDSK